MVKPIACLFNVSLQKRNEFFVEQSVMNRYEHYHPNTSEVIHEIPIYKIVLRNFVVWICILV